LDKLIKKFRWSASYQTSQNKFPLKSVSKAGSDTFANNVANLRVVFSNDETITSTSASILLQCKEFIISSLHNNPQYPILFEQIQMNSGKT